jgi:signal peptidase I
MKPDIIKPPQGTQPVAPGLAAPNTTNSQPSASSFTPDQVPAPSSLSQNEKKPSKKSRDGLKSVLSTLAILIIAPLIALFLTAFVFQSYEVDGPSMESTLQNHDRLIVLKVPRTLSSLTNHSYIPHRNDIIVFTRHENEDFSGGQTRQLIKRVVGLPGDRVLVKDNILTIYNTDHPNGFQPDKSYPYGKVITTTSGSIDLIVPKDQVFVCGDNRTNSLDSRSFGPIKVGDIVGKLAFRVYPFSKADSF